MIEKVPLLKRPHAVYWLYGPGDVVLYIGMTHNIRARLAAHKCTSGKTWWPWVVRHELVWFEHSNDARMFETEQLRAIRPLCNPVIPEANGKHVTTRDGLTGVRSTWAQVAEAAEKEGTTVEAVLNEALRRYLRLQPRRTEGAQ